MPDEVRQLLFGKRTGAFRALFTIVGETCISCMSAAQRWIRLLLRKCTNNLGGRTACQNPRRIALDVAEIFALKGMKRDGPFQFSVAEILLAMAEVACCLALLRMQLPLLVPILVGCLCLLLYVSRGRVWSAMVFGAIIGAMLLIALVLLSTNHSVTPEQMRPLLLLTVTAATYASAGQAIRTDQRLFVLPVLMLMLATFNLVLMGLRMAT